MNIVRVFIDVFYPIKEVFLDDFDRGDSIAVGSFLVC